jgi:probable HAF family extracellular repeat protein
MRVVEAASHRRGAPSAYAQSERGAEPRPSSSTAVYANKIAMCAPASLALVAGLAAALWAPPARAQTITDLGTLPGGYQSYAYGINAGGQVVGTSIPADGYQHAFLYSGGVMTDLNSALPANSGIVLETASAINASGQIVAVGATGGATHAFLYSGGIITDLLTLPGDNASASTAINASGQAVGYSFVNGLPSHAFLYSGGSLTDLGTLGASSAEAFGINGSGQIVGFSTTDDANHITRAFLYSGGVMNDLGTLGGLAAWAYAINDSGQIVGWACPASGATHAFLYSGGVMLDLGTLGGSTSVAVAVNSSAQVVGYSTTADGTQDAFLYSGGVMIDLNSLLPANAGWILTQANAINDSGQIVGMGTINGQQHAFLMDTQPSITSLNPTSTTVGSPAFTLTVTGTNFIPGATVNWNGTALATAFVSATSLTAAVPASLIATPGTASLAVTTIASASTTIASTSVGATFSINPPPSPGITNLSPSAAMAGGPAFTLTVNGTNFVSGAAAHWGTTTLTTTFVSASQLTAAVPAGQIATPGTATVTVVTPSATSAGAAFLIKPLTPTITSLTPTSSNAGGAAFTLTINGTNFIAGAAAKWNGTALTTTFVSATKLTAAVPSRDIAAAGTASVTVTTTHGTSAGANFTINSGAPTIARLSPTSASAGGAAFNLTLTGTNFVAPATVHWKGTALQTIPGSGSTTLTAVVPAGDITAAGTASVSVTTTGGTSAGAAFPITPRPTITSLSPRSATARGATFTLTVNGAGFLLGATVKWGAGALTTKFVSATKLTAAVPAGDISKAATVSVTVVNVGGVATNAISFTVQ